MYKLILSVIIIFNSFLLAHCDGCSSTEHNSLGSISGNIKYDTRPVHLNTLTNNIQSIPPKKRVY